MDKLINIGQLFRASTYAVAGLLHAWKQEQSFRHEVLVLAALALLLLIRGTSLGLALLVLGSWLLVMAFELVNSSLENAFNMITQERDDRVKAGKDMAAAAVMLSVAANVGLWIFVFFRAC